MVDFAVKNFTKRYHGRYRDYINWPLSQPVALGDVGKWSSGKLFSPEFNVTSLGFDLKVRGGATISSRDLEGGVSRAFKAAGKAPVYSNVLLQANAGVSLMMKKRASFVLEAKSLRTEVVANSASLEKALVNLSKDADWWRHRVVIVSIVKADIVNAFLAFSGNQQVDISADAKTPVPFDISDVSLDLKLAFTGEGTSVDWRAREAVLAFQHAKLRKGKWYRSWEVSQLFLEVSA